MNYKVKMVLRLVLALMLLIFGFNKFFGYIPMEAPPEGSFMDALIKTGYMMPLIAVSEIVPGFLLLINKWKGFALAWLVPISVNIVAFHLTFAPEAILFGAIVAILNVFLIYANWDRFKSLFQ